MPARTILLFEDHIQPGSDSAHSSTELNEILGRGDQLALHAIIDNVRVAGQFDLWLEGSVDAQNWVQRSSAPSTPGNGDISINPISVGGNYQQMWSDAAFSAASQDAGPLFAYLRVRLHLNGGAAHVTVVATQRGGSV